MAGDARYLEELYRLLPRCHQMLDGLIKEMAELHLRKSADYGSSVDPLGNLRAAEEIGIPAWKAAVLRGKDKVYRINQYCIKGTLANEGVEDSFKDLAAYSLLALVLHREAMQKQREKE